MKSWRSSRFVGVRKPRVDKAYGSAIGCGALSSPRRVASCHLDRANRYPRGPRLSRRGAEHKPWLTALAGRAISVGLRPAMVNSLGLGVCAANRCVLPGLQPRPTRTMIIGADP